MKGFICGVATVVVLLAVLLLFGLMGFVNMRADKPPSRIEATIAGHAMDESVSRDAPKMANPIAADEANLIAGARLYFDHCALCHGDPVHSKSPLADSLNPRAPQFMDEMAEMPENENFYILKHGIRWTAMPGWKNVLSDQQTWQVV